MYGCPRALATIGRFLGLTIVLLLSADLRAQKPTNVLALHEGNTTHPANVIASDVFRRSFAKSPQNQFFEEYMDEDRVREKHENFAESLRQNYIGKQMNLVISDGWPALQFVLGYGEQLWPGVPKIFYFVDSRELPACLPI